MEEEKRYEKEKRGIWERPTQMSQRQFHEQAWQGRQSLQWGRGEDKSGETRMQ